MTCYEVTHVATKKGGGYTVSRADKSQSVLMYNMPTASNGQEQATEIMALLEEE